VATAAAVTVLADLTAGLAALVAEVSELRGEMTAFMTELRAMRTAELAALPPAGPAADVTPGESAVTTELRAMGTDLAAAAAAEPVAASVSEVTAAMRRELALQGDQEHGTGHGGRQQWQWGEPGVGMSLLTRTATGTAPGARNTTAPKTSGDDDFEDWRQAPTREDGRQRRHEWWEPVKWLEPAVALAFLAGAISCAASRVPSSHRVEQVA